MISNFKKVIQSIKSKGLGNTAKKVSDKLQFESRYRITTINLELRRRFTKSALVINYGKYKFNYYGGGDRGEILYHAFWNKMFLEELNTIKDFVKKGDTAIDIGGNLGFFVLILNELVGDSGKIYSFEPSKKLYHKLASTIKINNLQNVTLVNIALGESEESTTLHYNPKQSGLSSIISDFEGNSLSEEIKITTLDNFSKKLSGRVSFIKIDTEGYEPQVLRGAKELIKRDRPTIYIELGGDHQKSSLEALQVLKELDYHCEAENLDLKNVLAGVNFIATPKK
jgi:FkbM family methyltransferase